MPQKSAFKGGFARSFFEIFFTGRFAPAVFFVWIAVCSNAQNTSSCTNSDFELGDFTGWQGQTGNCCPINTAPSEIIPGRHTIMSGNGTDPNTCGNVTVVAPGGLYSARIGNDQIGAEAEKLSYAITVSPESTLFIYKYAVVLEDSGHPADEQPRFQIRVLNASHQLIDPVCGEYTVVADADIPGFHTCNGDIVYKDWTTVGLDLSAYIGQTLTIEFATGDCRQGAHFGYAYVDAYCAPLQINSAYCSGSLSAELTAPIGFDYAWNTGETTRTIHVNNPSGGQTYACMLTSVTGCTVNISTVLEALDPVANFEVTNSCFDNAAFSNISTASGNDFLWDFGDGTTSADENPRHIFSNAGIYNVALSISNGAGCTDSVSHQVTVFPPPTAAIAYPGSPFCGSLSVPQSVQLTGANNYLGGTFSAPAGLQLDATTGAIVPKMSLPGTYTVTYAMPTTAQNCKALSVTTTVTITVIPTASIQYPQSVYCQSALPQAVQLSGIGNYHGGFFTAVPNGLSIDPNMGIVTPALSLPGNYTVTYAIPTSGGCTAIPIATVLTIHALPNPKISDGMICADDSGHIFRTHWLDTQMGESDCSYQWFRNGIALTSNGGTYEAATAGVYSVVATDNATGCPSQEIFATVGQVATPTDFIASLSNNFTENATLTLIVEGGTGPYLFSIDGSRFEDTWVYNNLSPGTHTIAVTDANGCTNLTKEILVLDFPKFFTPNNDGYNDSWNIFRLRDQPEAQVLIYDRYGKLLKAISPAGQGWDGTYKGRPVPSDDYWFTVDYREMDLKGIMTWKRFRSHFAIKR